MNDTLPQTIREAADNLMYEVADDCERGMEDYSTRTTEARASLVSAIVAYARDERERGREEAYSAPYMVVVSEWRRRALGLSAPATPARPLPTHRCRACGALWILNPPSTVQPDGSWSLWSRACGKCCDNVAMGEQIEAITGWHPLCDPGSMGGPALASAPPSPGRELEAAARALLAEWDGPPAAVADKHFDRLRAALSPAPPSPAEDDDGIECTCLAPHPACPNCNGTGKVTP